MALDIESLLTPPDNWQWGYFKNAQEHSVRYGWNIAQNAKALIVIAEGRTECIEEYFELVRDLNAKGYACAIMDWQGHGLSYRLNNDNTRHHSIGFAYDVSDFNTFIHLLDHKGDFKKLPKILLAHSMGGNITLRYMAENPLIFSCAYLVSPMLGLKPKRIIKYAAPFILNMVTKLNGLNKHAFGQSAWNSYIANIAKFELSNDPIRREVQPFLFKSRPELQCSGVTFGWLDEALKSIALLHDPDYCRNISLPVFIALAGDDCVVDNNAAMGTAALLPDVETFIFPKAKHQIHREVNSIRDLFLESLENFIRI